MTTPVGSQSPAAAGQWAGPFAAPLVPIHATLLRTGQVAVWESVGGGDSVHLWDPATNTFTPTGSTETNIFCAGHCALPDGRLFVVGDTSTPTSACPTPMSTIRLPSSGMRSPR